jgi:hypothetical protein
MISIPGPSPPDPDPHRWRRPIDERLADVAAAVFAAVPFRLGHIGWIFRMAPPVVPKRPKSLPGVGQLIPCDGGLRYLRAAP